MAVQKKIDDTWVFTVDCFDPTTGEPSDADAAPAYRIYEDETGTPILTGNMALLDDSNTVGQYSEQITCSAANGFEVGKDYHARITATVDGVDGAVSKSMTIVPSAVNANVTQIEGADATDELENAVTTVLGTNLVDILDRLPTTLSGGKMRAQIEGADANTINASALASDAVTEIQNGLATAAELAKVPKSDSNVTWNATAAAQIQSEAADALNAYDPPTKTEMDNAFAGLNDLDEAGVRTAVGLATANLDTQLSNLQSAINDILTDTGTTLDDKLDAISTLIGGLNDLSEAQVNAQVDQALADYDPPTKSEMDARTLPTTDYATAANLSTLDGKVVTIDNLVDAIKASTDKFETMIELDGVVYKFTANALEEAPSGGGGGGPTAEEIADAVWDEAIADHLDAGSTGAKLNSAASAGDPWSTELPGSYQDPQAGAILANLRPGEIPSAMQGTGQEGCVQTQFFDAGEKQRVKAAVTATFGTLSIPSSPVVSLINRSGSAVYGISAINVTGYDSGSLSEVRAWFDLDTATPPSGGPIAPGTYKLVFTFNVDKSAGGSERRIISIPIKVQ